ncbi:MAG: DUF5685 family protein [Filifactoraceae bacterium]
MFGYIKVNKMELKYREFITYKGYYCGICMSLKRKFSEISRLSLNYDTTFLQLILSSLYEPKNNGYTSRCIAHPHKKELIIENDISEYSAAINVILSYYKLKDDYMDDGNIKAKLAMVSLKKSFEKAKRLYPEKAEKINESLGKLFLLEEEKCADIDQVSSEFGRLMADIFSYKDDVFKNTLEALGFNLGKYIYIVDAYEDRIADREEGKYNPFFHVEESNEFKENIKNQLRFILSCIDREIQKLPIIINRGIIDNILYSGMTLRLEKALGERLEIIEEEE